MLVEGGPVDHQAIEALRARYGVEQSTPLRRRQGRPWPALARPGPS